MKTLKCDNPILLVATEEMTNEVRKLASTTGSEEDEIDEMIRNSHVIVVKKKGEIIGFMLGRLRLAAMLAKTSASHLFQ